MKVTIEMKAGVEFPADLCRNKSFRKAIIEVTREKLNLRDDDRVDLVVL